MGLLIEDGDTGRIVRELASRTGETLDEAVKIAVQERLARLPTPRRAGSVDHARLDSIIASFRPRRVQDSRTDDQIIGYDENGLPA